MQQGQVGIGVGTNDLGPGVSAVVEDDLDLLGAVDHMVVGQDQAIGADDHPAAKPGLWLFVLVTEKKLEPGVFAVGVAPGGLAGVDTDHCR